MKKESKLDKKCRLAAERQDSRYEKMKLYKVRHKQLADKIIKLEMQMQNLQNEIDYGK